MEDTPNKLETYGVDRNPDGTVKAGSVLNPKGRPKRKTLTELIHAKLDASDADNWDALAEIVLAKIFRSKDKDILKTLWEYTDGKPKQTIELDDTTEKIHKMKDYVDKQIRSMGTAIPQEQGGGTLPTDGGTAEDI